MELRKSSNLHYINAIKGNMLRKLCNVDYRGKPAVQFKNLRDIYDRDKTYRLEPSNSQRSQKFKGNEVVCQGANKEVGRDSEEHDFGKTTLKQLKEKCKSKKRKCATSIGLNPEECGVKLAPDQDDSDLKKPLSSFRVKILKANKNRVRAASISEDVVISESIVASSSADDFPSISLKDESSSDKVIPYQIPATAVREYKSPTLNEASYDHLEDVEASSQILPPSVEAMDGIHEETSSSHILDFPITKCDPDYVAQPLCMILPTMDQNSEIIILDLAAGDCNNMDYLHGECPLILENDIQESAFPDMQIVAVSHPTIEFSASQSSNLYSSPHEELFSMEECPMEEHLICNYANRASINCLDTGMHLVLSEEKPTLDEQGQPSTSSNLSQQGDFQQDCISAESTKSVPVRPPERLLLTRKVLSPTSEEQLSLAMNSEQLHDHGDCEGDLCLGKQGSECKNVNVAETPQVSSSVNQTNGIISHPRLSRIRKTVQNSSPKGNLEAPARVSRFLSNVDTGCISLQGCSESAIAFSQRQMQDMNSLTMKLMTGLESIKDVLEKKCLFEACDRVTTSDTEEVMQALKNATKVEKTTKKQLSKMTRNCNRFCKIMSLAQEDTAAAAACTASNSAVQRERKKVVFADEAGGELCHVKLFKD